MFNIEFLGGKIFLFLSSILIFLSINTTYLCEDIPLNLSIRNNINGDFMLLKNIDEIQPGAFINIDWNKKKLMLPYSLRKGFISFSDRKWEWRYNFDNEGNLDESRPILYENVKSDKYIKHDCLVSKN